MKIYEVKPKKLVRLQIVKKPEPVEYLTLCECTLDQVEKFCKQVIEKQNISPFQKGNMTSINIREAVGAKNGKCKSISFRGISAKETMDLIIKELHKQLK